MNHTVLARPFSKLYTVLLAVLVTGCSKNKEPEPADAVKSFYEKLFQIVEQNSINRRKIDWAEYKVNVWAKVGSAKTVPETEQAMILAMALLKDNHSSIIVDSKRFLSGSIGCQSSSVPIPAGPTQIPDIGYVEVPGFQKLDDDWVGYAKSVQTAILQQDKPSLKGWIVDLRRNMGGYTYPMLGGIGPLIGDGICLYYSNIDDVPTDTLQYQNGVVRQNQKGVLRIDNPYQLSTKNPKIAVLISGATASAGEATAIAFTGLSNTRLFGIPSCGTTTSSIVYDLPFYGYKLNLFTSTMTGRNGKIYGQAITPDEIVSNDQVFDKATKWIMQ